MAQRPVVRRRLTIRLRTAIICKILSDPRLQLDLLKLKDLRIKLEVAGTQAPLLELCLILGLETTTTYLKWLLDQWCSEKGSEATIQKLIDTLRPINLAAAEALETSYELFQDFDILNQECAHVEESRLLFTISESLPNGPVFYCIADDEKRLADELSGNNSELIETSLPSDTPEQLETLLSSNKLGKCKVIIQSKARLKASLINIEWQDLTPDCQTTFLKTGVRRHAKDKPKPFQSLFSRLRSSQKFMASCKGVPPDLYTDLLNDAQPVLPEAFLKLIEDYNYVPNALLALCGSVLLLFLIFGVGFTVYWLNRPFYKMDSDSQTKILKRQITIQSWDTSVADLCQQIDPQNCLTEDSFITSKFLRELSQSPSQPPVVLQKTFPKPPPSYIPRQLEAPPSLDVHLLFQTNPENDIYLFSGIGRPALSNFTEFETSTSKTQLKENLQRPIKFVSLDYASHFEDYSKQSEGRWNIHWIEYSKGSFTWIKTNGSITAIQSLLHTSKGEVLEEAEFLSKISDQRQASGPVCISATSGTGKTVLLTQPGTSATWTDSNKIYLYLNMRELARHIRLHFQSVTETSFPGITASYLTSTDYESRILVLALRSGKVPIVLLVDGVDEVHERDMGNAFNFLKIAANWQGLRLWVTTMPYLRSKVEQTVGTLCHGIVPLTEDKQLDLITSYWLHNNQNLNNDTLVAFARSCLREVNRSLKNLARLPLHCVVIAEVMEQDAVSYASSGNRLEGAVVSYSGMINGSSTIPSLLRKFIEKRFSSKRVNSEVTFGEWAQAHMEVAMLQLFPEEAALHKLGKVKLSPEFLAKFGFLEFGSGSELRFSHKLFAEYFVALYASEILEGLLPKRGEFLNFIHLLFKADTNTISLDVLDSVGVYEFEHSSILYFLNYFVAQIDGTRSVPELTFADPKSFVGGCAYHDLYHLLSLFLPTLSKDFVTIFEGDVANLLFTLVLRSSVPLAEKILDQYKRSNVNIVSITQITFDRLHPDFLTQNFTLLHAAARRGSFEMVELLLKRFNFACALKEQRKLGLDVILTTLWKTGTFLEADSEAIQSRLDIIKALSSGGGDSVLENLKPEPFLREVDPRLVCSLVGLLHEKNKTRFLQESVEYLGADHFEAVFQCIEDLVVRNLVQLRSTNGVTLLEQVLTHFDPGNVTLSRFAEFGADFNTYNSKGDNLIATAIKNGRNLETIRFLLAHGGDYNNATVDGWSILHLATAFGNEELLEYVHNELKLDIDSRTATGDRALHIAANFSEPKVVNNLHKLVKWGADLTATDREGATALHRAAMYCNANAVKILLEAGADSGAKDRNGKAPIDLVRKARGDEMSIEGKCKVVRGFLREAEESEEDVDV